MCTPLFSFRQHKSEVQTPPFSVYCNECRSDIKKNILSSFRSAKESLYIHVYALTDERTISLLNQKAEEGVQVRIRTDKSNRPFLKGRLSPKVTLLSGKQKGLMHQKIFVIDRRICLLGSANLTTTSLRMHNNMVLKIDSPSFASYLENEMDAHQTAPYRHDEDPFFEYWPLPNPEEPLKKLLSLIEGARNDLFVAMFTFTHPEICRALSEAAARGVHVTVIADATTARGASRKALLSLENGDIRKNLGRQLMHHKFALIDDRMLIVGSANWTKSAFAKNNDFLFFSEVEGSTLRTIKKIKKYLLQESKKL